MDHSEVAQREGEMKDSEDLVTRAHRALVEANAGTPPREWEALLCAAHERGEAGYGSGWNCDLNLLSVCMGTKEATRP